MQYLVIVVLIAFIYFFFIKKKPNKKIHVNTKEDDSQTNEMIQCSKCNIYCELDDTILSNGKYYCSNECLKA